MSQRDVNPQRDPTAYASFWINHASRLLMRRFEERLRPLGFGMAYLPVTMALYEDGPMLQRDLAARAHVEQPTMAQLLARMERDGLVRREPHPTDRRMVHFRLTPQAVDLVPKAWEAMREVADALTEGFDDAEVGQLLSLLKRAVLNLDPELRWPEV